METEVANKLNELTDKFYIFYEEPIKKKLFFEIFELHDELYKEFNKDLPDRFTSLDLYVIFQRKTNIYYELGKRNDVIIQLIEFFRNESYIDREKHVFHPYEDIIRSRRLSIFQLQSIIKAVYVEPRYMEFVNFLLDKFCIKKRYELLNEYGQDIENIIQKLNNYNSDLSLVDKIEAYQEYVNISRREKEANHIDILIKKIVEYETNNNIEDKINPQRKNIRDIIQRCNKYNLPNIYTKEVYIKLLYNIENVINMHLPFNLYMIKNIFKVRHPDYNHIIDSTILTIDQKVIQIFKHIIKKYNGELFNDPIMGECIYQKYPLEYIFFMEFTHLNQYILNEIILKRLNISYTEEDIPISLLYQFPKETQLALNKNMDIKTINKLLLDEVEKYNIDEYEFNFDLLEYIFINQNKVQVYTNDNKEMKRIAMDIIKNEHLDILYIYNFPIECTIGYFLGVDITKFVFFYISNTKRKIENKQTITPDEYFKFYEKISLSRKVLFIKNDITKTSLVRYEFNKEVLKEIFESNMNTEYIDFFRTISTPINYSKVAFYILNNFLHKYSNIYSYDLFRSIILYNYPIEALIAVELNNLSTIQSLKQIDIIPTLDTDITSPIVLENIIKNKINSFIKSFFDLSIIDKRFKYNITIYKVDEKTRNISRKYIQDIFKDGRVLYHPTCEEIIDKIVYNKNTLSTIIYNDVKNQTKESNIEDRIQEIFKKFNNNPIVYNVLYEEVQKNKSYKGNYGYEIEELAYTHNKNMYFSVMSKILYFIFTKSIQFEKYSDEIKRNILKDIAKNNTINKDYIKSNLCIEYFNTYIDNDYIRYIFNIIYENAILKMGSLLKMAKYDKNIEIKNIEKDKPIIDTFIVNNITFFFDSITKQLYNRDTYMKNNITEVYHSKNDIIYLTGGIYYLLIENKSWRLPDTIYVSEHTDTDYISYYVIKNKKNIYYKARDAIKVYEYLFENVNHNIDELNSEIINQYTDYDINKLKVLMVPSYTPNIKELMLRNDYSQINHLYKESSIDADTVFLLNKKIIIPDKQYDILLKNIFTELFFNTPESEFTNEIEYSIRRKNIYQYLEHFFNPYKQKIEEYTENHKYLAYDIEYIIYKYFNRDYNAILEKLASYEFPTDDVYIERLKLKLSIEDSIKYLQILDSIKTKDFALDPEIINIETETQTTNEFQLLCNEYFDNLKIYFDTLHFKDKIDLRSLYLKIIYFSQICNCNLHLMLQKDKIIFETNKLDIKTEYFETVRVNDMRNDYLVDMLITSITLHNYLNIDFINLERSDNRPKNDHDIIIIKNKRITINVYNNKTEIINKLFCMTLYNDNINFEKKDILLGEDFDYETILYTFLQQIKIYSQPIKGIIDYIEELLFIQAKKINTFTIERQLLLDRENIRHINNKVIDIENFPFDILDIIKKYNTLEATQLKQMYSDINKIIIDEDIYNESYTVDEIYNIIVNINQDKYNSNNYILDKNITLPMKNIMKNFFNNLYASESQKQKQDIGLSKKCRNILRYHNFQYINCGDNKQRKKMFFKLMNKYAFLKNVKNNDLNAGLDISNKELSILRDKEAIIFQKATHYTNDMLEYIKNLQLKDIKKESRKK